jgi:hypothetical protein
MVWRKEKICQPIQIRKNNRLFPNGIVEVLTPEKKLQRCLTK